MQLKVIFLNVEKIKGIVMINCKYVCITVFNANYDVHLYYQLRFL